MLTVDAADRPDARARPDPRHRRDLGLGLVRLQVDHRRIEDVFADADADADAIDADAPTARDGGAPMTDPSAATPAGGSVIHDLGYRPYTGPRLGAGAIARALTLTGFRNAFGLGRSGKSKVLPFVLLALNLLPAVIVGGVLAFAGLDELPIGYAEYASTTQVLVGIFVASQAPVLFSRDLRHGTISLYLARPLRSSAYALSRWASLLGATLVFLLLPILILYVVALLGELDVGEQTRAGRHRRGARRAAGPLARRPRRARRVVVDPPRLRRGGHDRPARHRQRHRHGRPGHLERGGPLARSARSPACSPRTRSTAA